MPQQGMQSKQRARKDVQQGMSYLKAGDLEAARAIFSRLAEEQPELAMARFGLGQVCLREGDNEKALELLQDALALQPNFAAAKLAIGRARERLGDIEGAYEEYQDASQLDPSLVLAQVKLSRHSANEGDAAEGISRLREMLEHNPQQVAPRLLLANLLLRSGQEAAGKAELERAVELKPDHWSALSRLGQVYLREKNLSAARDCFERAVRAAPDQAITHFGLGLTFAEMGDHESAVAALTKSYSLNPRQPSAVVSIANSYLALEKPDDALRILHDAARRSRRSSALHQKIADIYVSQGRYVEAVEQYPGRGSQSARRLRHRSRAEGDPGRRRPSRGRREAGAGDHGVDPSEAAPRCAGLRTRQQALRTPDAARGRRGRTGRTCPAGGPNERVIRAGCVECHCGSALDKASVARLSGREREGQNEPGRREAARQDGRAGAAPRGDRSQGGGRAAAPRRRERR